MFTAAVIMLEHGCKAVVSNKRIMFKKVLPLSFFLQILILLLFGKRRSKTC